MRCPHRSDTLGPIPDAPDQEAWLDWLRHRRMAALEAGWLCAHAGVVPQWTAARSLDLAREVEALLTGPERTLTDDRSCLGLSDTCPTHTTDAGMPPA